MPRTCLIAAYDPWIIQLLRVFTEKSGFNSILAYEGQDVLRLAAQSSLDFIVLEANMPGMVSGWDVIHRLKADSATRHIPVLAIGWQDERTEGKVEGNIILLQGPTTFEEFLDGLTTAGVICPEEAKALQSTRI
jgi:DNA-binding response OmpR family regulator